MIIHHEGNFIISFGDNKTSYDPGDQSFYQNCTASNILLESPFAQACAFLNISALAKTKQVHGIQGIECHEINEIPRPFSVPADYIITRKPGIGIAVATADCLPIIFYDTHNQVIAVAHAGWRGILAGIAGRVVEHFKQAFSSHPEDLRIYFGPAAGLCCYEVGKEVIDAFSLGGYQEIFEKFEGRYHLDLTQCAMEQLETIGVPPISCNRIYNLCTICNDHYASHRRDASQARRQLTIVALK